MTTINEKLEKAVVGIAGLGGLGSTAAVVLARAGIGELILVDFDSIEKNNLNRQYYFLDQVGKPKTEAMTENLRRINPSVKVTCFQEKLNADNIPKIFEKAGIIAECFDKAEEKQMIVETVLSKTSSIIVSVSGLAGYGNSNEIQTKRVSERFILVGDGKTGIESEPFLTAARVGIAANHQANVIVEILVDKL